MDGRIYGWMDGWTVDGWTVDGWDQYHKEVKGEIGTKNVTSLEEKNWVGSGQRPERSLVFSRKCFACLRHGAQLEKDRRKETEGERGRVCACERERER